MSSEGITDRFHGRNFSKNSKCDNDFENSTSFPRFPPPRTPLNSIPDPSQCQSDVGDLDLDKYKATRSSSHRIGNPGGGSNLGTSRVSGRAKVHSEPNSEQSTPIRSYSRIAHGGLIGASPGSRPPQRVSIGNSAVALESPVQVPHFKLIENPLFWRDHNVQMKCLEATLVGALRREKTAEAKAKGLEAEIVCMRHLAHEREEDIRHSRALLRLQEEKSDNYKILQIAYFLLISISWTRIMLYQKRFRCFKQELIEILKCYQDFYGQGKRETLSGEVSELQDQLLPMVEENYGPPLLSITGKSGQWSKGAN